MKGTSVCPYMDSKLRMKQSNGLALLSRRDILPFGSIRYLGSLGSQAFLSMKKRNLSSKVWQVSTKIRLYFSINDLLNYKLFEEKIISGLVPEYPYICYIKLQFKEDVFKMACPQFAYSFHQDTKEVDINYLINTTNKYIKNILNLYGYNEFPISVLLVFKEWSGETKALSVKNLSKYNIKSADTKIYNFNKPLPLTTDERRYGTRLTPSFTETNLISHFTLPGYLGGEDVLNNFGQNYLHQTSLVNSTKVPLINFTFKGSYYLLEDNLLVYLSGEIDNISTKYILDNKGVLHKTIIDTIISKGSFRRQIGNVSLDVVENKVMLYNVNVKLIPIKPIINQVKNVSNPNFGTIDLETYFTDDGYNKVYAAGFCAGEDALSMFYIDKDSRSSEDVVLNCINEMLINKYHNYIFYAHNLSGYDAPFLLKTLLDFNTKVGSEVFVVNTIFRDARIISLTIKKRLFSDENDKKGKVIKITLLDSMLMLNNSLSNLGKAYDVDVLKGIFPHSFANASNLFYKGVIPPITAYDNLKTEEYQAMLSHDWDFKEECLKYLKSDIVSLYLIMQKFIKEVHRLYGVDVTHAMTISKLAFNIFMSSYYSNNIALITNRELWSSIKEAYFGGIAEVYKPYGENLYYYDVNSLYPYASLNDMPGLNCSYNDFKGLEPDFIFFIWFLLLQYRS